MKNYLLVLGILALLFVVSCNSEVFPVEESVINSEFDSKLAQAIYEEQIKSEKVYELLIGSSTRTTDEKGCNILEYLLSCPVSVVDSLYAEYSR